MLSPLINNYLRLHSSRESFSLQSVQLADEIFGMDWLAIDKEMKGDLIMIMNRSLLPIEFSSAHILTMNLESFGKVRDTFNLTTIISAALYTFCFASTHTFHKNLGIWKIRIR